MNRWLTKTATVSALVVLALLSIWVGLDGLQSANASPPTDAEPVPAPTAELHPEVWNAIDWRGPETGLSAVLKVIPNALAAIHWDADHALWRIVIRGVTAADRPTEGTSGVTRTLKPGDQLYVWIHGSDPISWTQEQFVEPVISFASVFSDAQRERANEEIKEVIAFFAARFGVWVSDLVVDYAFPGRCTFGANADGRPLIRAWMTTNPHDAYSTCFSHEYGHALHHVVGNEWLGVYMPDWMIEGIANWFDNEVWDDWRHEYESYRSYFEEVLAPKLRDANDLWPGYWKDLEDTEPNRGLSQMAIKHLVELIGEDSFIRALGTTLDPADYPVLDYSVLNASEIKDAFDQEWFEVAFGVSLSHFYESFEQFRRSVGPPLPAVYGRIVGEAGKPVAGVRVDLYSPRDGWAIYDVTDEKGEFVLTLLQGTGDYRLNITLDENGGYGIENTYGWNVCAFRAIGEVDVKGTVVDINDRPAYVPGIGVGWAPAASELPSCRAVGVRPEH